MAKATAWVLAAAIALGLWEYVRRAGLVSPVILASPSDIYFAFLKSGGAFLNAFQLTLFEIGMALAITWSLGVVVGLAIGTSVYASAVMGPVFASLFAIPLITWYPLLMIWFGIGPSSKIVYAVVSGFFPIALSTLTAVRHLDRRYIRFGRSVGCSYPRILFHILLPMALPSILTGLRIGTALSVIGVVVSEMLGSLGGLGFWITYYRSLYDTGQVYLGILLALACVLVVNVLISRLERRFGAWREDAVRSN